MLHTFDSSDVLPIFNLHIQQFFDFCQHFQQNVRLYFAASFFVLFFFNGQNYVGCANEAFCLSTLHFLFAVSLALFFKPIRILRPVTRRAACSLLVHVHNTLLTHRERSLSIMVTKLGTQHHFLRLLNNELCT